MHNTVPCGRPLSISTNFVVLLNFENSVVNSRNVLIYIFSEIHRKTIILFSKFLAQDNDFPAF